MELSKTRNSNYVVVYVLAILFITIFGAIILSIPISHAEDKTVNASITVGSACTMSGGGEYTADIAPGNYSEISGSTLTTVCNDSNGYSLYAVGFSGDNLDTPTNTQMIGSNSIGNISTATSGSDSYWAIKLGAVTSPTQLTPPTILNDFNNYHVIPETYTQIAKYTSSTATSSSDGASVQATYKVNVSTGQVAGTYTGKVKYTMVHPNTAPAPGPQPAKPGKIVYHPNASNVVGTMGDQDASNNQSKILYASNFSRTGYGFAGWNTEYDYSGIFYGPNDTITAPSDIQTKGLSLYAVWVKSTGSMQADATTACNNLTKAPTDGTADLSSVTALTDERDNQTYAIAKLADGKCWMIENLRLEAEYTRGADNEALSQGYDSSFIGLAEPEDAYFTNTSVANSIYSVDGSTTITILGSRTDYRFPRYNNSNTQSRQSNSNYLISNSTYSYGNYYTWPAAVADTTYLTTGIHDSTSICPRNWKIPTGYRDIGVSIMGFAPANGKYYDSSETSPTGKNSAQAFLSYPNNFLRSGYISDLGISGISGGGHYWSSNVSYSSDGAKELAIGSDGVNISTSSYKYYGQSIRCLIDS